MRSSVIECRSLRGRLTVLSSAVFAVALVAGAFALTAVMAASRVAALDEIAAERAVVVARLVQTGQVPQTIPVTDLGQIAQVVGEDGSVTATSPGTSRILAVVPPSEVAAHLGRGRDTPVAWTTRTSPYDDTARVSALRVSSPGTTATVLVTVPLRETEGVVRALRISVWLVVPLLTAFVAGVVWAATGRALRPVEELRAGAQAIAVSGGGYLPIPRRNDEIGDLARTLADVLTRLRHAADRQQVFVADAAHELRSPVAALSASIDVAGRYPGSYSLAEFVEQASVQVERLSRLVDDLLVLARVGAEPLTPGEIDLRQIVDEVVASESLRRDQMTVSLSGNGTAWAVATAVARVVRNLVANAIQHAATSLWVVVADGSVTVLDDGPGIAGADRERAFERFARLDVARDRDDGGTGLGLSIARETARALGGEVELDAADTGGVRVTLSLPAAHRAR